MTDFLRAFLFWPLVFGLPWIALVVVLALFWSMPEWFGGVSVLIGAALGSVGATYGAGR